MCRSRVRPGLGAYERRIKMDKHVKVICEFNNVDFRKKEAQNDILHAALEGAKQCKEYINGEDLGIAFPPEGEDVGFDIFVIRGSEPVVHAVISGIIKEFMDSFLAGTLRFRTERRS